MNWQTQIVRHALAAHTFATLSFAGNPPGQDAAQEHHSEADAQHFTELVPPLTPAMLRVATALVGSAEAEDVTQEAIIRAWHAWGTLRAAHALRPWLLRITVNTCWDWQRSRVGRTQRLTQPLPDTEAEVFATYADDPGASHHADTLDLHQALRRLPADLRIIVVLRYHGGMDASEIGTALDVPAATVRTRLRRALSKLREQLDDGAHSEPTAPPQEDDHA